MGAIQAVCLHQHLGAGAFQVPLCLECGRCVSDLEVGVVPEHAAKVVQRLAYSSTNLSSPNEPAFRLARTSKLTKSLVATMP